MPVSKTTPKICPQCKIEYLGLPQQKFCSHKCSIKSGVARKHRTGKIIKCSICGNEFYRKPYWARIAKYCSNKCRFQGAIIKKSKIKLKCKFCRKEYIRYRSSLKNRGSRFCSKICFKQFKKTEYYKNKVKGRTSTIILKKNLWIIFSEYIRQRDDGVCISCGKKDFWRKMDAGHYIPKTAGLALYFDERNVNCQCTYCNRFMHGNLSKYAIALRIKYGEDILEELDKERHKIRKINVSEYKEMIEKYKNKLLDKLKYI